MSDMYPEIPVPEKIAVTPIWKTLVSELESGNEERRQKLLFPRYDVTISYLPLAQTNMEILWQYYMSKKGALTAFYCYDLFTLMDHTDHYIGQGDGSTTIFDIPGRTTSSRTVYVNGVAEGSVSYLSGGGTADSDRVQFASAPAEGSVLTIDFTGYLRMKVRFLYDKLPRETFYQQIYEIGVELKGLSGV